MIIKFRVNTCVTKITHHGEDRSLLLELYEGRHYLRFSRTLRAPSTLQRGGFKFKRILFNWLGITRPKPRVFFSGDIHFECDGQGWGAYDVVQSVTCHRNLLSVDLIESAREEFDDRLNYEIELDLPDEDFQRCKMFLVEIFKPAETERTAEGVRLMFVDS